MTDLTDIDAQLKKSWDEFRLEPTQIYATLKEAANLSAALSIRFDVFGIRRWFLARRILRGFKAQYAAMVDTTQIKV